jgi:hypothetical protein
MKRLVIALALLGSGCSQSNFTEYTKELVASKRAFCAQAAGGPYQGYIAAGSTDTSVSVSASGCIIKGANVTEVTVPTGSIIVQPPGAVKP